MRDGIILLVEDNADDEALSMRAFARNNIRNPIVCVRDGQEAIDWLFGGVAAGQTRRDWPALILLDLKLPKVDGLEVLRRIRQERPTKLTPVVILTSSCEETDRLTGYALGANSYIQKPVDFPAFVEAVRQLGLYWLLLNQPPPAFQPDR